MPVRCLVCKHFHSRSASKYGKLLQGFLRVKIVAAHWPLSSASVLRKYVDILRWADLVQGFLRNVEKKVAFAQFITNWNILERFISLRLKIMRIILCKCYELCESDYFIVIATLLRFFVMSNCGDTSSL